MYNVKMNRANNITSIKPLYNIVHFFAMIPPYNATDKQAIRRHKTAAVGFSLLILFGFVASLYMTSSMIEIDSKALFLISMLCYSAATFQYLISIYISAFWNVEKVQKFMENFEEVDRTFPKEPNENQAKSKKLNLFVLEVVAIHLVYFLFSFLDFYINMEIVGVITFIYNRLLKRIEMYLIAIITLLMYNFSLCLKLRFGKLNIILESVVQNYSKKKFSNWDNKSPINACYDVRKLRVVYNLLTDMVLQFSTIFGFQIMFLYVYIGVMVLELLGQALHNKIGNTELYFFDILNLILGVVLAVTCQTARKEAEQSVTVCYNLLLHVDAQSEDNVDQTLRAELILLAQQATDQCPYFSAAGFFTIDYTMLFGLIGTVTSYVVVLIQIM